MGEVDPLPMAGPPQPPMTLDQALELAKVKHHSGKLSEAEALYRQILSAQPTHPDALHLLGVLALQVNRVNAAIDLISRAIKLQPDAANYHYNLGRARVAAEKPNDAIESFQQALKLRPQFPEALFQLGATFHHVRRMDEAIDIYRQAVTHWPNFAEAHNNLGNALKDRGDYDGAIVSLRQALMLLPENPTIHTNLGNAQLALGLIDDAIVSFRESLRLRPEDAETYYNLGNALRTGLRFEEAIRVYRRAIAIRPGLVAAHNNLGLSLQTLRNLDQAVAAFEHAIELVPQYPMAHYNLGLLLLLRGDFERGWPEFHWRWKTREFAPLHPDVRQPLWDGSDLAGKRILLHAEQGFGDTIQFARYVPLVAQHNAKVVLQVHPELIDLLRNVEGVHEMIEHGKAIPEVDCHCPLMSLPMVMKTRVETIPASVPYIRSAKTLAEYWSNRVRALGRGIKVGICWEGRMIRQDQRGRAIRLEELAPLASDPRMIFFSLQRGDAAAQTISPPAGMNMVDWTDDLGDFADTAALISGLDLVITVDTVIAHLAGALGRPVWVLLKQTPDWRWLLDREDSPWYPTMRLFRQQRPGDWSTPVEQVAEALRFLTTATAR